MDTYLVGGAVRDQLLGLEPTENDWVVVGATVEDLEHQGFLKVGRHFPVFLHPITKEEYALARCERKTGPGHNAFEVQFDPAVTLEQDLSRRDLTINAIARDVVGHYIDPCQGIPDLIRGCFRHVSAAFVEDPLRLLRVARFASLQWAQHFQICNHTLELMKELSNSGELSALSASRIWAETYKALKASYPAKFFEVLYRSEALHALLPPSLRSLLNSADSMERLLKAFQKGCTFNQDPLIRYGWLTRLITSSLPRSSNSTPLQTINAFNQLLGTPNTYAKFSEWSALFPLDEAWEMLSQSDAAHWIKILDRWDIWRRPQMLLPKISLLQLASGGQYLTGHSGDCSTERIGIEIQKICNHCRKISLTEQELSSFSGPHRQIALRHRRQARFQIALESLKF